MGKRKRLTALLCAVVMALTLLPVQAWATGEGEAAFSFASVALELDDSAAALYDDAGDEAEFVPETDPYFDHVTVTRYGRTKLAQEQNSKALLDVYDALVICAVVTNLPQDYVVLENGVDKDTFVLAAQAFRADYPELFWAVPASMYLPDDPDHYIAVSLQRWSDFAPDENGSDAYLTNKKREFLANVESLLDGLPAGSDYDKELYLHDRLIERTEYDSDYEEQQSAFSVVMESRGVCAGYAFAFQYLLMRAGIESYYVVGQSYGENHAWNLVKVDGQWYYVILPGMIRGSCWMRRREKRDSPPILPTMPISTSPRRCCRRIILSPERRIMSRCRTAPPPTPFITVSMTVLSPQTTPTCPPGSPICCAGITALPASIRRMMTAQR